MNYTNKFMRDPGTGDMGSLFGEGDGNTPPVIPPVTPPVEPTPPVPPVTPPTPPVEPPAPQDPPAEDPPAEGSDDTGDVWADVNQLRGRELKFELPEGVEPDTPEAVIHFEKAVRQEERATVYEELKQSDPRAYAYKLHREKGGSDEEFFAVKSSVLPNENQFSDSIDLQRQVYESSLIAKGLEEADAKALSDKAVADKTIGVKAKAAYDSIKVNEQTAAKALEDSLAEERNQNATVAKTLIESSTKLITENSLNIRIPEEEKAPFMEFFQGNVVVDKGKAYLAMELNQKDLTTQQAIEQLYLLYKKGDLSSIVRTVAATGQVNKFKRAAAKAGVVPQNQQQQQQQNNNAILDMIPD